MLSIGISKINHFDWFLPDLIFYFGILVLETYCYCASFIKIKMVVSMTNWTVWSLVQFYFNALAWYKAVLLLSESSINKVVDVKQKVNWKIEQLYKKLFHNNQLFFPDEWNLPSHSSCRSMDEKTFRIFWSWTTQIGMHHARRILSGAFKSWLFSLSKSLNFEESFSLKCDWSKL